MNTLGISAGIFAAVFALDFAWARYNIATAEKHITRSAVYSVIVYLLSAFVTIQYITDPWKLLPACFGAAAGTAFSVWSAKRARA